MTKCNWEEVAEIFTEVFKREGDKLLFYLDPEMFDIGKYIYRFDMGSYVVAVYASTEDTAKKLLEEKGYNTSKIVEVTQISEPAILYTEGMSGT